MEYRSLKTAKKSNEDVDLSSEFNPDDASDTSSRSADCDDEETVLREWTDKMETIAKEVDYEMLLKHVNIHFEGEWDEEDLRSSEFGATIYSPYAIPHAVRLEHSYFSRVRWSSREWGVSWRFKLLRFDVEHDGDAAQILLASQFPSGLDLTLEKIYHAGSGMEVLCR